MPKTASTMVSLGVAAPDFNLPDVVSGQVISLNTFADRQALLVIFASPHCPFVQHIKHELVNLERDYAAQGLGILAISANDPVTYPDDAPEKIKQFATELGFTFPFAFDDTQEVAKAYQAACTPDFFLFDANRKLVYRGQLDDSRPGNDIPVTGRDLRQAIEAALSSRSVDPDQKPSIGCNIKWKVGNEPSYYGAAAGIAVGTAG